VPQRRFGGCLPPPPTGERLSHLHDFLCHLTALDHPGLREIALGGPNSATRLKTVWQHVSGVSGSNFVLRVTVR
jgi:hypothetical protein